MADLSALQELIVKMRVQSLCQRIVKTTSAINLYTGMYSLVRRESFGQRLACVGSYEREVFSSHVLIGST